MLRTLWSLTTKRPQTNNPEDAGLFENSLARYHLGSERRHGRLHAHTPFRASLSAVTGGPGALYLSRRLKKRRAFCARLRGDIRRGRGARRFSAGGLRSLFAAHRLRLTSGSAYSSPSSPEDQFVQRVYRGPRASSSAARGFPCLKSGGSRRAGKPHVALFSATGA